MPVNPLLNDAPMQTIDFAGRQIYLKRDDLLNPYFSGNKARKLGYFLDNDFPQIKKIVGHGSAQANSLYSLAALAKLKNWQLDFYVERIPQWMKSTPMGNYGEALRLGANIIEVKELTTNLDSLMRTKAQTLSDDSLFVPEGGRCALAKHGIAQLAKEIEDFCKQQKLIKPVIMLPSGTGTTALFLQLLLPFKVITCSCVGSSDYLKKQFAELESNNSYWPEILPTKKKYHFGKLYPEFYSIWQQLKNETNIEFELLYDPLGWLTLLDYLEKNSIENDVIYIHQGGLVGNQSMLPRYQRKYLKLEIRAS
jgi:1-aminocyclopropane-1-carboxylate deaminase